MKKKHLKDCIVSKYLELIKDEKPLEHDLICSLLNIPVTDKVRTSIPYQAWRILNQCNKAIEDLDKQCE